MALSSNSKAFDPFSKCTMKYIIIELCLGHHKSNLVVVEIRLSLLITDTHPLTSTITLQKKYIYIGSVTGTLLDCVRGIRWWSKVSAVKR